MQGKNVMCLTNLIFKDKQGDSQVFTKIPLCILDSQTVKVQLLV